MRFPTALQLYSVRDDMESDFEGTIRSVKEMGYDGVEFAGLFGKSAKEVKELLCEVGLVPLCAHVPYYDMLQDPVSSLSPYAEIGCEYVAVPYLNEECRPGTDGFAATVEGVRKIAKAAKGLGLQLLYHNHDFEFLKLDGKYALDILYDTVPADLLKTELDTCWVNIGGEDPAGYIEKYSGRAPIVHLKDFYKSDSGKSGRLYKLIGIDDGDEQEESSFEFRPVGYGMQDFKKILASCEKAGTKWVVVEQDNPSMDKFPLECAEMSIDYLNGLYK